LFGLLNSKGFAGSMCLYLAGRQRHKRADREASLHCRRDCQVESFTKIELLPCFIPCFNLFNEFSMVPSDSQRYTMLCTQHEHVYNIQDGQIQRYQWVDICGGSDRVANKFLESKSIK